MCDVWATGQKSHWWTLSDSWNSTVTALHWGKLSFCWDLFHLEHLQQMERPLALLARLCLLVFKWTCSHPETSRAVSFLLSHFCSPGLHNIESQAAVSGRSHIPCYALCSRWLLVRGRGWNAEGRSRMWFPRGDLLGSCLDWSSLAVLVPSKPALVLNSGRHWQAHSLWGGWLDLLSITLYSLEWERIYWRSGFLGMQA